MNPFAGYPRGAVAYGRKVSKAQEREGNVQSKGRTGARRREKKWWNRPRPKLGVLIQSCPCKFSRHVPPPYSDRN